MHLINDRGKSSHLPRRCRDHRGPKPCEQGSIARLHARSAHVAAKTPSALDIPPSEEARRPKPRRPTSWHRQTSGQHRIATPTHVLRRRSPPHTEARAAGAPRHGEAAGATQARHSTSLAASNFQGAKRADEAAVATQVATQPNQARG